MNTAHTKRIEKWEAAFARYVAALAKLDASHQGQGTEWHARRTLHAAKRHLAKVEASL